MAFTFIALLLNCLAWAQHPDNILNPDHIQHDLDWLEQKVLKYHPACRNPVRRDSVRQAFAWARYEAEKPIMELQFLKLLRQTLIKLRCGHSTAIPSKAFYKYYREARPKPLFPLQIFAGDEGMIVRYNGSNDTTIAIGDKLVTLNRENMYEVTSRILDFLPGDGYHDSFKKFHLSLNFPTYYLFYHGPSYSYEAGILDTSGRFRSHVFSLRASGKPSTQLLAQKSIRTICQDDFRSLGFLSSNKEVAVMQVAAFGGSNKWYKKAFQELKNRKTNYLILDLRGNTGGNLFNANTLLRYLLPDTFSFAFEREKKRVSFGGHSNMNLAMRLTLATFRWLPGKTKGFGPTCESINNQLVNRFRFKPVEDLHYNGKIVVLMDGGTFSAASLVAAKLRKHRAAPLLGDESGGGASGTYAMLLPTLTLPKTKMRVVLPLYYINHEMESLEGRGLLPDLYLIPNVGLKVKGIDSELEYLSRNLNWFK